MSFDGLADDQRVALEAVERHATAAGIGAYLVGGAVRDDLLGRAVVDVDVAVEGDAPTLARQAGGELGVAVKVHRAFGTAALLCAEGRRVDLAGTRVESYAGPAALPVVRPGSLLEDLPRRDFRVNSMARQLQPAGAAPGPLIDPTGGAADLESGRLQVHHERSFQDDPTRILRGVRFEERLGFRLVRETERWVRAACAERVFDDLSSDRLVGELTLLLDRERIDVGRAWTRLGALGVLEALGLATPAENVGSRMVEGVRTLERWEADSRPSVPISRCRALLNVAVALEPADRRARLAKRLLLEAEFLLALETLVADLETPGLEPHALVSHLERLETEELLAVCVVGGPVVERRVLDFFALSDLELEIDGGALLAHGFGPGPEIGSALRATRAARLDGRIEAHEELEYALAVLSTGGLEP